MHRDRICQRLISLKMLKSAPDAPLLSQHIIDVLASEFGISGGKILGITNDRAAVNGAALNLLAPWCGAAVKVPCFSHTLANCGKAIEAPAVTRFFAKWNIVVSHSIKAGLLFKEIAQERPLCCSKTRWFSSYEQYAQLMRLAVHVPVFLDQLIARKICDKSAAAAKARLTNQFWLEVGAGAVVCAAFGVALLTIFTYSSCFFLQLAAVVDCFGLFAATCYDLETDAFIAPRVYDRIVALWNHVHLLNAPNLHARASSISGLDNGVFLANINIGMSAIKPGIEYFVSKFFSNDAPLKVAMGIFKAARWFDAERAINLQQENLLEELKSLPFLSADLINGMIHELPTYLALHGAVPDLEKFWKVAKARLPFWSEAAFLVALLQPSSGCVERVFSLLRNLFTNRQECALEDYVQGSVKLTYNQNRRLGEAE